MERRSAADAVKSDDVVAFAADSLADSLADSSDSKKDDLTQEGCD